MIDQVQSNPNFQTSVLERENPGVSEKKLSDKSENSRKHFFLSCHSNKYEGCSYRALEVPVWQHHRPPPCLSGKDTLTGQYFLWPGMTIEGIQRSVHTVSYSTDKQAFIFISYISPQSMLP